MFYGLPLCTTANNQFPFQFRLSSPALLNIVYACDTNGEVGMVGLYFVVCFAHTISTVSSVTSMQSHRFATACANDNDKSVQNCLFKCFSDEDACMAARSSNASRHPTITQLYLISWQQKKFYVIFYAPALVRTYAKPIPTSFLPIAFSPFPFVIRFWFVLLKLAIWNKRYKQYDSKQLTTMTINSSNVYNDCLYNKIYNKTMQVNRRTRRNWTVDSSSLSSINQHIFNVGSALHYPTTREEKICKPKSKLGINWT